MDSAGLPRILSAIFYDTIIVFAIIFVAAQWFPLVPDRFDEHFGLRLLKQAYIIGICFLYFTYSWRRGGQTIGMKSWRIRLEQNKPADTLISWRQCALRFSTALISWLVFGLGFFWILFSAQNRSWHDIASTTKLIVLPKAAKPT